MWRRYILPGTISKVKMIGNGDVNEGRWCVRCFSLFFRCVYSHWQNHDSATTVLTAFNLIHRRTYTVVDHKLDIF